MFNSKSKQNENSVEKLLETINGLNGDEDVKITIRNFLEKNILMATGIMIIWTHGKHVDIDGTRFSEPEAVWALEKAKHQLLDKGLSFND